MERPIPDRGLSDICERQFQAAYLAWAEGGRNLRLTPGLLDGVDFETIGLDPFDFSNRSVPGRFALSKVSVNSPEFELQLGEGILADFRYSIVVLERLQGDFRSFEELDAGDIESVQSIYYVLVDDQVYDAYEERLLNEEEIAWLQYGLENCQIAPGIPDWILG